MLECLNLPESCWELHTNTQIRYGFLSASTGHGTSHKENVFGFAVSGGDIEESILTGTLSGPDIITGGSFGLEASIISLILGTILSAFYLWKILKSQHL